MVSLNFDEVLKNFILHCALSNYLDNSLDARARLLSTIRTIRTSSFFFVCFLLDLNDALETPKLNLLSYFFPYS